jgi:DNA-binding IclR family transcriptional regulator
MIQVAGRLFSLLELIGDQGRLGSKTLAEATGLNHSTTCNLLASLVELGYLEKTESCEYQFAAGLYRLVDKSVPRRVLLRHAPRLCAAACARHGERTVVAVLSGSDLDVICEATYADGVIVSTESRIWDAPWDSATGRILIAHLDAEARRAVIASHGLPGEAWDGIASEQALDAALAAVRQGGPQVLMRTNGSCAVAVPLRDARGAVHASLGVSMLAARWEGDHRALINACLAEHASELSRHLGRELHQKEAGGA